MSMGVLVVVFGVTLWVASLFIFKFVKEWVYAVNDRRRGKARTRRKIDRVMA